MKKETTFRRATSQDIPELEEIRQRAFAPVFESFRNILGERIYRLAQEPEDAQQADMLRELIAEDSPWSLFVLQLANNTVGFISFKTDSESGVGEIGLNAIDPAHAGDGLGTKMYEFALERMRVEGMKVATVATGGDPGHAPARRAYKKAGFDVQIPSVWLCKEL